MLNVTLAGDHLYGKLLFSWLSLVMSDGVFFGLSLFPRDVLDEIWDLIESVSESFPTYCLKFDVQVRCTVRDIHGLLLTCFI